MEIFVVKNAIVTLNDDAILNDEAFKRCADVSIDYNFLKDGQLNASFEASNSVPPKMDHSNWNLIITKKKDENYVAISLASYDFFIMLTDIKRSLGIENITVQVTLSELCSPDEKSIVTTPPEIKMRTKAMPVEYDDEKMGTFQDDFIQCPDGSLDLLGDPYIDPLSVKITIKMTLTFTPGWNMFLNDESKDVTIFAQNGKEFKGHKLILAACSPVFETMFRTNMNESYTHTIEMEDLTAEAVRAFVQFMYYQGKDKPNDKCEIAFELLHAAHKYDVAFNMEAVMREILLSKPVEWYDMDMAFKLFLFSRNLLSEEGPSAAADSLKMKAVEVIKAKAPTFQLTPTSKEMFQKNPDATAELFRLALSSNPSSLFAEIEI